VTPDADDYNTARLIFNRAFDRHPALIVYCASTSDVARSLEFAQRTNVPIAVRGGGHNRAGFSTCDNGMVLDLSRMNQVTVDVASRVARAAGGALTINLDAATQKVGLATTSAGCPTVGIAGLTLGGGEGLLMSKYGAACDNLISAQLVTVDGQQIRVSQNANQELFWAIRGGGGNFGVVTALECRLHPLSDVLAGTLVYSNGPIPELLQAFAKFVAAAPDEMWSGRSCRPQRNHTSKCWFVIVGTRELAMLCLPHLDCSSRNRTASVPCPTCRRTLRTGSANGKIALRPLFHVHIFPIHIWTP
jgi:FAD/FMN-containing dehydrogenase